MKSNNSTTFISSKLRIVSMNSFGGFWCMFWPVVICITCYNVRGLRTRRKHLCQWNFVIKYEITYCSESVVNMRNPQTEHLHHIILNMPEANTSSHHTNCTWLLLARSPKLRPGENKVKFFTNSKYSFPCQIRPIRMTGGLYTYPHLIEVEQDITIQP